MSEFLFKAESFSEKPPACSPSNPGQGEKQGARGQSQPRAVYVPPQVPAAATPGSSHLYR